MVSFILFYSIHSNHSSWKVHNSRCGLSSKSVICIFYIFIFSFNPVVYSIHSNIFSLDFNNWGHGLPSKKSVSYVVVFLGDKETDWKWFWGVNDTIFKVFTASIHKKFVKEIKQLHPKIQ